MTTYWGLGSCGRREGSVDQGTFLRIRPSLSISMETPKTGDLVIGLVGHHHWYQYYWDLHLHIYEHHHENYLWLGIPLQDVAWPRSPFADHCFHHHPHPSRDIFTVMRIMSLLDWPGVAVQDVAWTRAPRAGCRLSLFWRLLQGRTH